MVSPIAPEPAIAVIGAPAFAEALRLCGYRLLFDDPRNMAAVNAAIVEAETNRTPYVIVGSYPRRPEGLAMVADLVSRGRRVVILRSDGDVGEPTIARTKEIETPCTVDAVMGIFGADPKGEPFGVTVIGRDLSSGTPAPPPAPTVTEPVAPAVEYAPLAEAPYVAPEPVAPTPAPQPVQVEFEPTPAEFATPVQPVRSPVPSVYVAQSDDFDDIPVMSTPMFLPADEPDVAAPTPPTAAPVVQEPPTPVYVAPAPTQVSEPPQPSPAEVAPPDQRLPVAPEPTIHEAPQSQTPVAPVTPAPVGPSIHPVDGLFSPAWGGDPQPVAQPVRPVSPYVAPPATPAPIPVQQAQPAPYVAPVQPQQVYDPYVAPTAAPANGHEQAPAPRVQPRTTGVRSPCVISLAGKGGVGKTTSAISLAQRAVEVGGLRKVILIDANRGQGDVRKYLRAGGRVPTIYDAVVSGDPQSAVIRPGALNAARDASLPEVRFGVVFAPPNDQARPEIVSTQAYLDVIDYARSISDLVVIDTQIVEANDTSGLIDDMVIPLLLDGAWGLALSDSSMPGMNNLIERLQVFRSRGVPRDRIMFALNKMNPDSAMMFDKLSQMVAEFATYIGAIPQDGRLGAGFETGRILHSIPEMARTLDEVLYRVTGLEAFDPSQHADAGRKRSGGLARLRRR